VLKGLRVFKGLLGLLRWQLEQQQRLAVEFLLRFPTRGHSKMSSSILESLRGHEGCKGFKGCREPTVRLGMRDQLGQRVLLGRREIADYRVP